MKLAIVGKGGVGKTTLAAALARAAGRPGPAGRRRGRRSRRQPGRLRLGVPADAPASARCPNAGPDSWSGPALRTGRGGRLDVQAQSQVDDLPERFSVDAGGVRLLVLGTVELGRQGLHVPGRRRAEGAHAAPLAVDSRRRDPRHGGRAGAHGPGLGPRRRCHDQRGRAGNAERADGRSGSANWPATSASRAPSSWPTRSASRTSWRPSSGRWAGAILLGTFPTPRSWPGRPGGAAVGHCKTGAFAAAVEPHWRSDRRDIRSTRQSTRV